MKVLLYVILITVAAEIVRTIVRSYLNKPAPKNWKPGEQGDEP